MTGRFRGGAGRGVRRTALHAGLLEAATAAGVRIEHGDIGPVSQDATSVHCSGFQRPLPGCRRRAALADPRRARPGAGVDAARVGGESAVIILMAPWSDCVEVYWSDDAEAYVTPVADDCVGVAILTSRQGGFDEHLDGVSRAAGAGVRSGSRP